jgi:hypothetical protein
MKHQFLKHPDDERIEAYVLGRLEGQQGNREEDPELEAIEQHLLFCHSCVEAAESFQETAEGVRLALSLKRSRRTPKPRTMTAGQLF